MVRRWTVFIYALLLVLSALSTCIVRCPPADAGPAGSTNDTTIETKLFLDDIFLPQIARVGAGLTTVPPTGSTKVVTIGMGVVWDTSAVWQSNITLYENLTIEGIPFDDGTYGIQLKIYLMANGVRNEITVEFLEDSNPVASVSKSIPQQTGTVRAETINVPFTDGARNITLGKGKRFTLRITPNLPIPQGVKFYYGSESNQSYIKIRSRPVVIEAATYNAFANYFNEETQTDKFYPNMPEPYNKLLIVGRIIDPFGFRNHIMDSRVIGWYVDAGNNPLIKLNQTFDILREDTGEFKFVWNFSQVVPTAGVWTLKVNLNDYQNNVFYLNLSITMNSRGLFILPVIPSSTKPDSVTGSVPLSSPTKINQMNYTLRAYNTGSIPISFDIKFDKPEGGWKASLSNNSSEEKNILAVSNLDAGRFFEFTMSVSPPLSATVGEVKTINLMALNPVFNVSHSIRVETEVTEYHEVVLHAAPTQKEIDEGQTVSFIINVENRGVTTDTFDLIYVGVENYTASFSNTDNSTGRDLVTIPQGSSTFVFFNIKAINFEAAPTQAVFLIRASLINSTARVSSELNLTVTKVETIRINIDSPVTQKVVASPGTTSVAYGSVEYSFTVTHRSIVSHTVDINFTKPDSEKWTGGIKVDGAAANYIIFTSNTSSTVKLTLQPSETVVANILGYPVEVRFTLGNRTFIYNLTVVVPELRNFTVKMITGNATATLDLEKVSSISYVFRVQNLGNVNQNITITYSLPSEAAGWKVKMNNQELSSMQKPLELGYQDINITLEPLDTSEEKSYTFSIFFTGNEVITKTVVVNIIPKKTTYWLNVFKDNALFIVLFIILLIVSILTLVRRSRIVKMFDSARPPITNTPR